MPNKNWKHAKKPKSGSKALPYKIKKGFPSRLGVIVNGYSANEVCRRPVSVTIDDHLLTFETLEWGAAISTNSEPFIVGKGGLLAAAKSTMEAVENLFNIKKRMQKEKTNDK